MLLSEKVVLVTASTRGIGLAIAKACAAQGARVYMAARNLPQAEAAAEEMNRAGGDVHCVYNDADRPETFAGMVDVVVRDAGRIDVLVNNFGSSDPRTDLDIRRTEYADFEATVIRNLRSVYIASQSAAAQMARQGGGSIINISSVGGEVPDIAQVGYGVSKAAINYLTKLTAVQCARDGIRCNAVLPGMTATDSVRQKLTGQFREQFVRHIPLGRMALPEEIAAAVVYLASDAAAYVTGQILSVSGGFGLATPLYADMLGSDR